MSIMPAIHPPRSRLSRSFRNDTTATILKKAMRLMAVSPATWQIEDDDLAYGE